MSKPATKNTLKIEGLEGAKTVSKISLQLTGLFSFPVRLYTPFKSTASYAMHLGCPDCLSPIQQPRRCSNEKCSHHTEAFEQWNKPVKIAIVDEKTIQIKDEELDELNLPTVEAFVTESICPAKDVESLRLFGDGGYYLVPENAVANMAYAAVVDALKSSKQVIVGRYTIRGNKERLAIISPVEGCLVVSNIPMADQVKDIPKMPPVALDAKAKAQAQALLTTIASTPLNYPAITDRYADAMQALVEEKLKTGTVKPKRKKKSELADHTDKARQAVDDMFAAALAGKAS